MRILITGVAGFIGSHFVDLINKVHPDWEVWGMDALTYAGDMDNLKTANLEFVKGDIRDSASIASAFKCKPDLVVNFAAETHVDKSLVSMDNFVSTNIVGVYNLLEWCRLNKVQRFMHISTDECYGDILGSIRPSMEYDPIRPTNPYAASKASAELLVNTYHLTYGLDTVISRGSNTYGPRQFPEKIIPLFIMKAIHADSLPVYGTGLAKRQYIYVEDHCRGIEEILLNGLAGETYNVGGKDMFTAQEIAAKIIELAPTGFIEFVEDRVGHDMLYNIDSSKLTRLTGWEPHWNFDDGLAETIAYYRCKINAHI